jgi:protein FrlC
MKIAMFTSGYMRNRLEDIFKDAKEFGYDGIELWGGRPHAYAPDLKDGEIVKVNKLKDYYDIPIIGYTPEMNAYPYNLMSGTSQMQKEAIDYVKLSMDMSQKMGAEFTLISAGHAGYYLSNSEIWKRVLNNLEKLVNYAERIDHKLVIEPLTLYESNVIRNANDLQKIFEQIESDKIFGMCDVVPAYVHNEPIMSYFNKLGDKIHHLHLVDSDGKSDTHLMPGDGNIPLKELLIELEQIDYQGYLTIELVTQYINEPRLYARRAINRLKKLII